MRFLKAQLDVDMEQESKGTRERQIERCTFREARGRGGNVRMELLWVWGGKTDEQIEK